jgi:hypothetical protein
MPLKDQVFKRLTNKAKRGMRGWPLATIAFYGPDASRATKVVVSIIPSRDEEVGEMRDRQIVHGDVRKKPEIAAEMLAFMEAHGVKSVVMSDGLMGCPHQESIDYEGEWCPDPACAFWHGRDRFTGKLVHLDECLITLVCNYEVAFFSRFQSKCMLPETRNVIVADTRPTRHRNPPGLTDKNLTRRARRLAWRVQVRSGSYPKRL